MLTIALWMLLQNRLRFVWTVSGFGMAFFLSAAPGGLLIGWCYTTSALIRPPPVNWSRTVFQFGAGVVAV
jgi:hypothetical protein